MRPQQAVLVVSLLVATATWPLHAFAAQFTLTWMDTADNEVGFRIERRMGLTGTFGEIAIPAANTTSYVDSSLAASTTYCYRVGAFNGAGDSGYSNEACATTSAEFALTVVRSGTGSGSVSSAPSGISCGADCSEPYLNGTTVTLTAAPAAGSTFAGWSAGCNGGGGCVVTLTANTLVSADFEPAPQSAPQSFALTVTRAGKGSGSVSSAPSGISCGTDCSEPYLSGTTVTLTAAPAAGSTFAGWSGACSGKSTCTVSLTADTTVTASFRRRGNARK